MRAPLPDPSARADDRHDLCPVRPGAPSGFSLVELLIVLALLLALATLYFGFSSSSHQRNAKKSCEANLQKIFLAQEIYARDNGGKFPVVAGAKISGEPLDLLVPRYAADREIFHCPGSKDATLSGGESLSTHGISYAYYMGRRLGGAPAALMSDAQVNTHAKSVGDEIFSASGQPPGNNHHQFGGNILFTDGQVEPVGTNLVSALPVAEGVVLLNPKP